jgi:NitT/TauT family transport system substrate-binding protein
MARWWLGIALAGSVVLGACGPQAGAPTAAPAPSGGSSASPAQQTAPAAPTRVRAAWGTDSGGEITLWAAQEAGLFVEQGLDVNLERIAGGTSKPTQVMIAGELDIMHGAGPALVDAQLAGADIVALTTASRSSGILLYGDPTIRTLADLRGKSLAVTRAGTLSDFTARYALTQQNLRPEADVGLIQTGGNVETLAAMQSGSVAAGMIAPPFDVAGRKLGYHEVIDAASLGLEFPSLGLQVQRDYLAQNADVLQRFVRAYVAASARVYHDEAFAKQTIGKFTGTDDPEALDSSYAAYGRRYHQRAPYPTVAQYQSVIEFTATREPRARELQPERLIDDRFVRTLDQEGFIDRLYQ